MANIKFDRKEVEKHIKLDDKTIERINMFGVPASVSATDLEIEVFPNRPDLISLPGFIRAIKAFLGKEMGLKKYRVNAPEKDYKVKIESSVKEVRPYTACAIVKNLNFDDVSIKDIINVQEKLHSTLGRNRKKIAIGIYPFDKIKKYAYFPLQFQPEETIDVRAPYFANQIETARLVAMSLPDDYTLVVKEHPGMIGKRPPSYIEKVARTVNVKLIDYRIPTEKVLKGATLVISPSSTTIAEAAFLKIPAIQLGDLGTTLKLPNVTHHTDMTTLSKKIRGVISNSLETDEYERRLENYVAAVFDTGFDYNYIKAWEQNMKDMDELWNIYKNEIKRIL